MKIICKLKRAGGTKVELGKTTYHFVEDKDGDHVAEVTDEKHIARLLSIPEAYIAKGAEEPAAPDTSAEDEATEEFPLADLDIASMTNKDRANVAKKHLGISGTSKTILSNFAKEKLGIQDLVERNPKASYIDLLTELLMLVQIEQRKDKAEFLADAEAGNA